MSENIKKPLSVRIIPWYFVMFFTVLAIVNIIFVTMANKTHPGVVNDNAYKDGLNYNEVIAMAERGEALGRKTGLAYTNETFILTVKDKQGMPFTGAHVKMSVKNVLGEPRKYYPQPIEVAPGIYEVSFTPDFAGQADIHVAVIRDGEASQIKKRMVFE